MRWLFQGRALLNAIGNLELSGAYAEALTKLGHNLEDVAKQVRCLLIDNHNYGIYFTVAFYCSHIFSPLDQ